MIVDYTYKGRPSRLRCQVAVVGCGPAGVVTALELARAGIDVIVVESGGGARADPAEVGDLSRLAQRDAARHAPMDLAVRRGIGGTSAIWGGRCVPFDPIDFERRDLTADGSWPIGYDEIAPYFARASAWLLCGRPVFTAKHMGHLPEHMIPLLADGEVLTSSLERWSLPTDFGRVYSGELASSRNVRLCTGLTCLEVLPAPGGQRADGVRCLSLAQQQVVITSDVVVVAAGGLETTRLLMHSRFAAGRALGDQSGHLGHWYMAHVEGVVADLRLTTPPRTVVYDYERDIDGTFIRRRITFDASIQRAAPLPNIALWMTNPELADARHHLGPLSLVYLALRSPLGSRLVPPAQRVALTGHPVPGAPYGHGVERSATTDHLVQIVRQPLRTGRFATRLGRERVLKRGRRSPGFFVAGHAPVFPLQFHGEHLPSYASKVTLADQRDALGMRRLAVDIRFADADIEGAVRAHGALHQALDQRRLGAVTFRSADPWAAVGERLGGGFHQAGTTRMASSWRGGVVDRDLKVFGTRNVFVASSSTFVTSGQANSTFMIVTFAIRLADEVRRVVDARARCSASAPPGR
ncbi:GMC family oxidoreductase [Acidimicrobiaceae bacterium USS-CC1]|uniref:GMC family oxidoreductase n=1 Tax=Acidiferrimicrobium australe TaxID=2664430 RepID=A0ABW9QQT1_9ACTN|nr:GMC family oxidoreductase [Acidiferrimicrobium australe]